MLHSSVPKISNFSKAYRDSADASDDVVKIVYQVQSARPLLSLSRVPRVASELQKPGASWLEKLIVVFF
jgi:hypothetical protein